MSDWLPHSRRRLSRKRVLLTAVALVLATVLGVEAVSRVLFAPWSISIFGRETLTGRWTGALRARQGAEYRLSLDLRYRRRSGSSRSSAGVRSNNLEGHATLCTSVGKRYDYAVAGFASRSGVIETLWLEYGDPRLSALNLRLSGAWHPPALSLTADANPFLPDGTFNPRHPSSGDDPDDAIAPFDLAKRDDERAVDCSPSDR